MLFTFGLKGLDGVSRRSGAERGFIAVERAVGEAVGERFVAVGVKRGRR